MERASSAFSRATSRFCGRPAHLSWLSAAQRKCRLREGLGSSPMEGTGHRLSRTLPALYPPSMTIRQLSRRDHQPHRRRRGGRAAGQRRQGAGRERARCRRQRDRDRHRGRRPVADPRHRRRQRHDARRSGAGRRAARHLEARRTKTCSPSARWAFAARRCRRSARSRICRSHRGRARRREALEIVVDRGAKGSP